MKKTKTYDQTKKYEEEIQPMVQALIDRCFAAGIPCFFTAAVVNTPEHTEYVADGYLTGSSSISLTDDHIKHCLMVHDGCVARPPREAVDEEIDEFLNDSLNELSADF